MNLIGTVLINDIAATIKKRVCCIPVRYKDEDLYEYKNYRLFYKLEGSNMSFLELISLELQDTGTLGSIIDSRPDTGLSLGIDKKNIFYLKILLFKGEVMTKADIKSLNEQVSHTESLSLIMISTDGRGLFELGIKYPHMGICGILKDSLAGNVEKTTDLHKHAHFENLRGGPKSTLLQEDDGRNYTATLFIGYTYILSWFIGLALEGYSGGDKFYIFFDSDLVFFISNLIALIIIGELVENSYRTRRFLFIVFISGIICNVPYGTERFFFEWMMPVVGAFLYLVVRVPYILRRHIIVSSISVSYVVVICLLTAETGMEGLTGFFGIPAGFAMAGGLGFEREISNERIKKISIIGFVLIALFCFFTGMVLRK